MGRLIFVPQFPTPLRYQSWWFSVFEKEFKKYFDEVVVIGKSYCNPPIIDLKDKSMFSPIEHAINFETSQITEYLNLNICHDDTLFLSDISFPGVFCNVLYHKPCPKMFAFCHATSLNKYDYFAHVRKSKFKIESTHASMFDKVFFGSNYSLRKTGWKNGVVVYLPSPPISIIQKLNVKRDIPIVSVCRPNIQKVNKKLEKLVEKSLGIKVYREEVKTWFEYSNLLSRSKINLISSKEETFNYSIIDSIECGCIPIVPNTLCFPEILPEHRRYKTNTELINMLRYILTYDIYTSPVILCQYEIDNFYKNMIEIMLK